MSEHTPSAPAGARAVLLALPENARPVPLAREYVDELLVIERASHKTPWSRAMFESEIEKEIAHFWVFLAEPDARVMAYGGFWNMVGDGNITNITVAEEYRKRGLGKAVLLFLLEEMRRLGMTYASLEVRYTNNAAIALYESCGFARVGRRKNYYTDGCPALVYAKRL